MVAFDSLAFPKSKGESQEDRDLHQAQSSDNAHRNYWQERGCTESFTYDLGGHQATRVDFAENALAFCLYGQLM